MNRCSPHVRQYLAFTGAGSVYNATLTPPNNQCGTYTLRGTAPHPSSSNSTAASTLNITVLAAANATSASASCAVQTQIDSSSLPSIAALPVEATGAVKKWSPSVRPFSLQPVYLVQVGSALMPANLPFKCWVASVVAFGLQHVDVNRTKFGGRRRQALAVTQSVCS